MPPGTLVEIDRLRATTEPDNDHESVVVFVGVSGPGMIFRALARGNASSKKSQYDDYCHHEIYCFLRLSVCDCYRCLSSLTATMMPS